MDVDTVPVSQQDPAFEFNAPRWYDFQRLNESMPSPTADADAYFFSSQVKGLRTPTRNTEAGQDEELGRLQEDLERVREEMRDEATSARRQSHAVSGCRSPGPEGADEAEPMHEGGEDEDAAAQLASTPPAQAVEAEDESVPSPGSPPAVAVDDQEEALSPAQPADDSTDSLLQQVPSEATAAQTGPQPWPMPPLLAAAAQSAAEVAANEAKPRLPPSNLVTSWGPSAPARRIMAHTAPGPPSILAGDAGDKEAASSAAVVAPSLLAGGRQSSSAAATAPPAQEQLEPAKVPAQLRRSPGLTPPKDPQPKQAERSAPGKQQQQPAAVAAADKALARKHSVPQPAKKPAGKALAPRPLTKPKSTKFGTSMRRQLVAGLSGSSVARQLDQARQAQQSGTANALEAAAPRQAAPRQTAPKPAPPKLAAPKKTQLKQAKAEVAAPKEAKRPAAAGAKRPTRPVSRDLRTSKRQRATSAAPAQQEAEEWRPLALMVAQFEAATPARFNKAGPRAMQTCLIWEKNRVCQQAPELAVEARLRPSHYKPQEEREMDEIASLPPFKARPVDPAVMNSQGQLGVTHVPPKPPTTGHAPVLATEKRAAAHSKPAEEPVPPPPKPAAKFDPMRLTVAQSPKLATTARTRSQSMAPVPEEPAFVFKARPLPGGGGQAPVARATRTRRNTTSFQPFHLSTEERGGAKQLALEEAAAAKRAAGGRVLPFQAAPVPPTLRQPAPLPPVAEKPPTAPQPFNLASEARHHQAVVLRESQNGAREAKRRRDAAFKAAPAPAHPTPRPPRPSRQPPTAAKTPDLTLRTRSIARVAFDAAVAENQRRAEEAKGLEQERAAKEEAAEVKRYRRSLTFKARPAPGRGVPLYDLSDPDLLQSPFQNTRSRSRLMR
ncbi:hypothetical protein COCSUDRAFT_45164 [Coccomyxa subellipsoidea C-169]|uniref:TPX2 C-terminal domain-containing protein n=1 Tax=Coccomyxa subellipsoidea (strain C-169) TaxID=574566 RepID=I0YJW1_COCSC|nr:hypothetical protein COCSUDRAFT_45164 [Coccomyxa subellipsoidea C-169]EIE18680.1 hypothetical protein COCSUDRAFT_45164 [Coccomyxa subellipsoidea C-169]|eukprot:XP_005643224.1 hypothetical protein COCSUDRAFT_45164 [Coccomyxa subellipsoidea C-169]